MTTAHDNLPDFETLKRRIRHLLSVYGGKGWQAIVHDAPNTMLITIERDADYLFDIDDAHALAFSLHETTFLKLDSTGNIVALLAETSPVVYKGSKRAEMHNRMLGIIGALMPAMECRQTDGLGNVVKGTWREAWEHWNEAIGVLVDSGIVKEDGGDGFWYVRDSSTLESHGESHFAVTDKSYGGDLSNKHPIPDFDNVRERVLASLDDFEDHHWKIEYDIRKESMKIVLTREAGHVFDVGEQFSLAMTLHEAELKVDEGGRVIALYDRSRPISYLGRKREVMKARMWDHLRTLEVVRTRRTEDADDGGLLSHEWDIVYHEWEMAFREFFERSIVDDHNVDMYWYVKGRGG